MYSLVRLVVAHPRTVNGRTGGGLLALYLIFNGLTPHLVYQSAVQNEKVTKNPKINVRMDEEMTLKEDYFASKMCIYLC